MAQGDHSLVRIDMLAVLIAPPDLIMNQLHQMISFDLFQFQLQYQESLC